MSDNDVQTTPDRQRKRYSKTSSTTVHTANTPPPKRITRGQAAKDRKNEEEKKKSPKNNVSEDDDEPSDVSANEDNDYSREVVQTKLPQANILSESQQQKAKPPAPKTTAISRKSYIIGISLLVGAVLGIWSNNNSDTSSHSEDWRSQIDPNGHLSTSQRVMISASLKPILDKSFMSPDEGVSTLLILSPDEEVTAKLAQCLLQEVIKQTNDKKMSTEIDLRSHRGGKLALDSKLRKLLNTSDTIRAVLLRHIDNIPSDDELDQLRLLFAYCDGENPVVPHRLIIMTATSDSKTENGLRETFKTRLPDEHDFIDALMSRISGHTLYLEKDQQSIC